MVAPVIVKLGGSLGGHKDMRHWLDLCVNAGAAGIVAGIVPGGGVFADAVRAAQGRLEFDRQTGHALAVMAMEMYGHVLCRKDARLAPAVDADAFSSVRAAGKVPVWFASKMLIALEDARRDWSVTSDSLAVWLARRLGYSRVVLVKAAALPDIGPGFGPGSDSGADGGPESDGGPDIGSGFGPDGGPGSDGGADDATLPLSTFQRLGIIDMGMTHFLKGMTVSCVCAGDWQLAQSRITRGQMAGIRVSDG